MGIENGEERSTQKERMKGETQGTIIRKELARMITKEARFIFNCWNNTG